MGPKRIHKRKVDLQPTRIERRRAAFDKPSEFSTNGKSFTAAVPAATAKTRPNLAGLLIWF